MSTDGRASLTTQTIHGVFWTGGASLLALFIPLALYAFLAQADVGLYEGALNIVMLLALVGDLGLSSALVQFRQAADEHYSATFWVSLAAGLAITATAWATAPWVARLAYEGDPRAFQRVFAPLMLLVPFAAVSGVFRARLQFNLRLKAMAVAEMASVLVYGLVVAVLLALDMGLWSAILGALVREVALLAAMAIGAGWWPSWRFSPRVLRDILPFGLHFTGSRTVNYLSSNLASFVVFNQLGHNEMASYKLADRLTTMPLLRLSTVLTRVSFPTFASMQADDALLRRSYLKFVQSIALVFWPALLALVVLAPRLLDLIGMPTALGPVRLLAAATIVRAVGLVVGSVYMAKGRANWSLYWSVATMAVLLPGLIWSVGGGGGVEGICQVLLSTSVLFLVASQYLAGRLIDQPLGAYLRVMVRPGLVALVVGAVLAASAPWLPRDPWMALAAGGVLAGIAFGASLRLLARDLCQQYWRGIRG